LVFEYPGAARSTSSILARTDGTPEEQERRKEARAEARRMWENAAGLQGRAVGTKEG